MQSLYKYRKKLFLWMKDRRFDVVSLVSDCAIRQKKHPNHSLFNQKWNLTV